jgi:hypothetical protein
MNETEAWFKKLINLHYGYCNKLDWIDTEKFQKFLLKELNYCICSNHIADGDFYMDIECWMTAICSKYVDMNARPILCNDFSVVFIPKNIMLEQIRDKKLSETKIKELIKLWNKKYLELCEKNPELTYLEFSEYPDTDDVEED